MYRPTEFEKIDQTNELKAITDYIKSNWEGFNDCDIELIISNIWENCFQISKYQFDKYKLTEPIDLILQKRENKENWIKANPTVENEMLEFITVYDDIYKFFRNIFRNSDKVYKAIFDNYDFETQATKIEKSVKNTFLEVDFNKIKPKGWSKLNKNYHKNDGIMELDDDKIRKEFKGFNSSTACGPGFHYLTSLPYVMQDYKEQGRKPLTSLIQSILTYVSLIQQHNNSCEISEELNNIYNNLIKKNEYKYLETDLNTSELTNNKIINAIIAFNNFKNRNKEKKTSEEINQCIAVSIQNKKDFVNLSKEEQNEIQLKNTSDMKNLLSNIFNKLDNKNFNNKTEEEKLEEKTGTQIILDILHDEKGTKTKLKM